MSQTNESIFKGNFALVFFASLLMFTAFYIMRPTLPVFLTREPGLALMQALGNYKTVLPFTVVLNRQGVIVSSHVGAMTREKLDAAVQLALKPTVEPSAAP